MIIIGYPCIGKDTLSKENKKVISFDANNFFIGKERSKDWYKVYCNIVMDLSNQGYIVFVPSYEESIVNYLCELRDKYIIEQTGIGCILPSKLPSIKEYWLRKASDKMASGLSEDIKVYRRMQDFYDTDIEDLNNKMDTYGIEKFTIRCRHYELSDVLNDLICRLGELY